MMKPEYRCRHGLISLDPADVGNTDWENVEVVPCRLALCDVIHEEEKRTEDLTYGEFITNLDLLILDIHKLERHSLLTLSGGNGLQISHGRTIKVYRTKHSEAVRKAIKAGEERRERTTPI